MQLVLILIASIALTNLIERSYQYLQDGHFKTVPFSGITALNLPLFVSTQDSVHYLPDSRQRALFQAVYPKMLALGLVYQPNTRPSTFDLYIPPLTRFKSSYDLIAWQLVLPSLRHLGYTDLYENDTWLANMALILAKHHWQACLGLYLKNIVENMGGYYYTFLLLGFLGLLGWRLCLSSVPSTRQKQVVFFLMLAHFANYTATALVQIPMKRYTLYTDPLQIALLLLVLQAYIGPLAFKWRDKKSEKE